MKYEIKKLSQLDWQKHKEIRLEALKNDPSAFGRSYVEELKKTNEEWQEQLIENNKLFYAVCLNNQFVSLGGAYKNDRGEWNIMAVYTKKEFRGQGCGMLLMEGILNELENRGIKKIFLKVNIEQLVAISLYKKVGFDIISTFKNQLLGDGKCHDEYEMAKEFLKTKY